LPSLPKNPSVPTHDVQRDRRAAWRIVSFSPQTRAGSLFFWERTEIERLAVVGCPQLISGERRSGWLCGHKDVGENLAELSQTAGLVITAKLSPRRRMEALSRDVGGILLPFFHNSLVFCHLIRKTRIFCRFRPSLGSLICLGNALQSLLWTSKVAQKK
jgi:hypothetical protein